MTLESWDHRAHLKIAEACMVTRTPFLWQGPGVLLVSGSGLSEVLKLLPSVIGLEAFEMDPPELHPRLDLIYDRERTPVSANDFSREWPGDVWVDISLRIE